MLWWTTRSTSLVALVLLTVVLVLGVAAGSGRPETRVVVQSVHRAAALLAVLLVAVHVATVVADPHVELGVVDVVVPFGSGHARLATGLGTVAVDLLLAVVVTSALRTRLGGRAWRAVHAMAYALWPVAALHGVGAGTDERAVRVVAVVCGAAVLGGVGWRLVRGAGPRGAVTVALGLVATGLVAGVVA